MASRAAAPITLERARQPYPIAEPGRFPHPSSEVRARYAPLRNRWRAEHPCRTPRCTVVGYLRTLTRPLGRKTVEQVRASTLDRLVRYGDHRIGRTRRRLRRAVRAA